MHSEKISFDLICDSVYNHKKRLTKEQIIKLLKICFDYKDDITGVGFKVDALLGLICYLHIENKDFCIEVYFDGSMEYVHKIYEDEYGY